MVNPMLLKSKGEYLYSLLYLSNGELTEINYHAKNLKAAKRAARKVCKPADFVAIGLTIGAFENKNGIYI
jgi:hypothetical protein